MESDTKDNKLSKLDMDVYCYVLGYFEDYGYSPAIQEILKHTNCKTKNEVEFRLRKLRNCGKIRFSGKKFRPILDPVYYETNQSNSDKDD